MDSACIHPGPVVIEELTAQCEAGFEAGGLPASSRQDLHSRAEQIWDSAVGTWAPRPPMPTRACTAPLSPAATLV